MQGRNPRGTGTEEHWSHLCLVWPPGRRQFSEALWRNKRNQGVSQHSLYFQRKIRTWRRVSWKEPWMIEVQASEDYHSTSQLQDSATQSSQCVTVCSLKKIIVNTMQLLVSSNKYNRARASTITPAQIRVIELIKWWTFSTLQACHGPMKLKNKLINNISLEASWSALKICEEIHVHWK